MRTCVTLCPWKKSQGYPPILPPHTYPHLHPSSLMGESHSPPSLSSMKHLLTTSFFPPTVSCVWVHPAPVPPVPAGDGPAPAHLIRSLPSWGHQNLGDIALHPRPCRTWPLRPENSPTPVAQFTQRSPLTCKEGFWVCLRAPSSSPHQSRAKIPADSIPTPIPNKL